jgi:carboxyl-terminal processing protease
MLKRKGLIITTVVLLTAGITLSSVSVKDKEFKIIKNLDIFYSLFKELNYFYVDETDPEKLIEDGINGMLKSLDPYTTFIPESELDEFAFMTTGKYGGIGALIRSAGNYTIISEPYEGFPAQKGGLMAGDTIIEIDGKSIKGLEIKDVSDLLKGDPDTKVKLTIHRPGEEKRSTVKVTREQIKIDNVPYFGMLENQVGYILLSNFTEDASLEVKNAMQELTELGAKGIVLDLRGNPGGLLIESVKIANLFVEKGTEIVSTRGKVKNWDKTYVTEFKAENTDIPLVVLVNSRSASASEIVAGSIQDLDRGVIIGQRTFGKGLVQTSRPLSYNTRLKVTTAKYYIPSGRCIQAIDYAHRNPDGSVGKIPDTLISEFSTLNGRKVFDGGGITPDIPANAVSFKRLTTALHTRGLLFDFATHFRIKYASIPVVDSFAITDEIYREFIDFVESREFEYETESDQALKQLMEKAKKEMYYETSQQAFDNLAEALDHDVESDLMLVRDEVSELLRQEIVVRYFYQKGQIKAGIKEDIFIHEAIKVLSDVAQYDSVLANTGEVLVQN